MADRFFGNSSQKYLDSVATALESSDSLLNKDPFASQRDTPPSAPRKSNSGYSNGSSYATHVPLPIKPSFPALNRRNIEGSTGNYILGIENESNVVLGDGEYQEIIAKIRAVDSAIAERLFNIASEIEEMCATIYIVPSTLPKYLRIVDKIKSSLSEFQDVTENVEHQTRVFVNDILDIDRG